MHGDNSELLLGHEFTVARKVKDEVGHNCWGTGHDTHTPPEPAKMTPD